MEVRYSIIPYSIAITPDGAFAYVTNRDDGTVSVIQTNDNTVVGSPIEVGSNPAGIAVWGSISSPTALSCVQKKNDFGLVYELFNTLYWQPSPSTDVAGYFVYRNGSKIARVSSSTFLYEDHNREKNVTTRYSVTAFSLSEEESILISVTIN